MPPVALAQLIAAARSGEQLISFPTDTVPALAVRPDRAALIFATKQRSHTKPLILMAAAAAELWPFVAGSEFEQAAWQQVAARYWPGALTLVLPASDRLPAAVNPLDPTTVGIRVPNHPLAQQILAETGPLATTSVNRSGQPPLLSIPEINAEFPEVLTLEPATIDKGNVAIASVPSTVVQWATDRWTVLRQGSVAFEEMA